MIIGHDNSVLIGDKNSSRRLNLHLCLQGGGARGAATAGFLAALMAHQELNVVSVAGTSAGAMVGATLVAGLAKEKRGGHWRREQTRDSLGELFQTIADMQIYDAAHLLQDMQRATTEVVSRGFFPTAVWSTTLDALLAASRHMTEAVQALPVLQGRHPLVHVLTRVLENDTAINSQHAPLFMTDAVREQDGQEHLFHNRGMGTVKKDPMTFAHIAASGALTAFLKSVDVPHVGLCRDGAQGGANPPIMDAYRLRQSLLGADGDNDVTIIYNLSDPGEIDQEIAARPTTLHDQFRTAMMRNTTETETLNRHVDPSRIYALQADLTEDQRRASLGRTDLEHLSGMYARGYAQGKEFLARLCRDHGLTMPPQVGRQVPHIPFVRGGERVQVLRASA